MNNPQSVCAFKSQDYFAKRLISAYTAGKLDLALHWGNEWISAGGENVAEAYALCATILERLERYCLALEFWDKCLEYSPHNLAYLEKAWHLLTGAAKFSPEQNLYAGKWREICASIYTAIPSISLLRRLEETGVPMPGSMGIANGEISGWLWLKKNEKPIISTDLPLERLKLRLQPLAQDADNVLCSLKILLPPNQSPYHVSITDSAGRHVTNSPLLCSAREHAICSSSKKIRNQDLLTIIIPVFDDREATLSCLGSVFASRKKNRQPFKILAVWDHGPDARLHEDLKRLAKEGKLDLLETPRNYAFLACINYALSHIPHGDVLLLNSDTLVHGDWLDRLAKVAKKPDAATVTPMGSQAELMSFPSWHERGEITNLAMTARIDDACAKLPEEKSFLKVPAGVGFCMWISRRALDSLGGLDGLTICKGYGEESEFCLRAQKSGLINYGAWNIFVAHLQGRSFGSAKWALASQNSQIIRKHYPGHNREYDAFLQLDEARPLRERISRALCVEARHLVLEIMPISLSWQPYWHARKRVRSGRERGSLFVEFREGKLVRAFLKIRASFPLEDMEFVLPEEVEELKKLIQDFSGIVLKGFIGDQRPILSSCLDLSQASEASQPDPISLINWQNYEKPGVFLVCPPASIDELKLVVKIARAHPGHRFYIYEKDRFMRRVPMPENVHSFSADRNWASLDPQALLFLGRETDLQGWQAWLEHVKLQIPMLLAGA